MYGFLGVEEVVSSNLTVPTILASTTYICFPVPKAVVPNALVPAWCRHFLHFVVREWSCLSLERRSHTPAEDHVPPGPNDRLPSTGTLRHLFRRLHGSR